MRVPSRIAFLVLFFAILVLSACDQTINYPAPTLVSITPNNINANSPQFTLRVMGKNFVQQTSVNWTTSAGTVTIPVVLFANTNELDATIPSSLIENPGDRKSTV